MAPSHASEIERRGVRRASACAERADVGPRTASTGRRGRRRQLSGPRRATSAAGEHGIPVEAAWQAACCLADALNDALLRVEVEEAAPKPGAACRFLHLDTQQQCVVQRVRKTAGGLPCGLHGDAMLARCRESD
eukprot:SM000089S23818  [mRNA]  locus=s89:118883:119483:- [translate_table: standard]